MIAQVSEGVLKAPDMPEQAWGDAEQRIASTPAVRLLSPTFLTPIAHSMADIGGCQNIPSRSGQYPASYLTRKHEACVQLALGASSGIARSLIVVSGFVTGLTCGVLLERRLRPCDYQHHRLRFYDRYTLAALSIAMILIAILLRGH